MEEGEKKVIDYLLFPLRYRNSAQSPPAVAAATHTDTTCGSPAFCHSQEEEPGCQRPKFRCWFDSLLLQIAPAICIIPTTLMKSNPIVPIITDVVVVVVIPATHENFIQRRRRSGGGQLGGCNPSGRKQRGRANHDWISLRQV